MDASPAQALRIIYPQIPLIFKTILYHTLSWSPTANKWDLKTELITRVLRSILNNPNPRPIDVTQRFSLRDPGVKGPMWIVKVDMPKPSADDLRAVLFDVIDGMKEGFESYTKPELEAVKAEWTAYRPGVGKSHLPESNLSDKTVFSNISTENKNGITVLYMHGGAHYMMSTASHRPLVSALCKRIGGRALSVNYRLSPQNPFPAALLDALLAYVYLLYPPEDALHKAVAADRIVFAGDSAGGQQCTALLQLLLQIQRMSSSSKSSLPKSIGVYGHDIPLPLPLPAGLALSSPWLDITRAMPSIESNADYDYLPPPSKLSYEKYPPCSIWPTNPPREDLFCNGNALCHPLVSPLAALDWRGSPPFFLGLGEEMLSDENAILARRLSSQGVHVRWEQYEAMCHCFAMVFDGAPFSRMFLDSWSRAIRDMVLEPAAFKTEGHFVRTKSLDREEVDVEKITDLSDERVSELMCQARERKIRGVDGEAKTLPRL